MAHVHHIYGVQENAMLKILTPPLPDICLAYYTDHYTLTFFMQVRKPINILSMSSYLTVTDYD